MSVPPKKSVSDRYDVDGNIEAQYVDAAQEVLKNKKGIMDLYTSQVAEEEGSIQAYDRLFDEVLSDAPITTELILHAHDVMFGDLYEWAGRWRTVRISKPGASWPPPDFLSQAMELFEHEVLRLYPASALETDDIFCDAIGHIQGEFLAIHPFREGNARTIKLVTDLLGAQSRRPILQYDMSEKGRLLYIEAAKSALNAQNYKPLQTIIRKALYQSTIIPSIF